MDILVKQSKNQNLHLTEGKKKHVQKFSFGMAMQLKLTQMLEKAKAKNYSNRMKRENSITVGVSNKLKDMLDEKHNDIVLGEESSVASPGLKKHDLKDFDQVIPMNLK